MSEHMVELLAAWQRHVAADRSLLDWLVTRHREGQRRYHGVSHLAWILRHVAELTAAEEPADLGAIVAAAFYHDAIYEPASLSNEAASALLARRDLAELGWSGERIDRVAAMIEATTHAASNRPTADIDTSILLDADLAVLAADPAGYQEYAAGVRAEYRHVDDGDWRAGRSAVLRGLLARDHIYSTRTGRERWEQRARANVAAELATLGG